MTKQLVILSPELADKAHSLMCEVVGAWNTGSIVTYEVRSAVRRWLVDVADAEQERLAAIARQAPVTSKNQTPIGCPLCGAPAREQENWRGHYGCSDVNCGAYHAALSWDQWNRRPTLPNEHARQLRQLVADLQTSLTSHERRDILAAANALSGDSSAPETSPDSWNRWRLCEHCGTVKVLSSIPCPDNKPSCLAGHFKAFCPKCSPVEIGKDVRTVNYNHPDGSRTELHMLGDVLVPDAQKASDDEDSYIHGPGTFPHSEGCRCERCSPPESGKPFPYEDIPHDLSTPPQKASACACRCHSSSGTSEDRCIYCGHLPVNGKGDGT